MKVTEVNPKLQQSMSTCVPVSSLLGKRKRKKDPNPNPLFSKWLAEWRDEAKDKGWKSEFIYSKVGHLFAVLNTTLDSDNADIFPVIITMQSSCQFFS